MPAGQNHAATHNRWQFVTAPVTFHGIAEVKGKEASKTINTDVPVVMETRRSISLRR